MKPKYQKEFEESVKNLSNKTKITLLLINITLEDNKLERMKLSEDIIKLL